MNSSAGPLRSSLLTVERRDFELLDSTQTWTRKIWSALPRDRMTVVVAKEQTNGCGRLKGRIWNSPKGNLYLTLTLFIDINRPDFVHLSPVAALAVRRAAMMHGISGKRLQLKWPNDLCLTDTGVPRKVGGILVETFISPPHRVCCIGVGLNVHVAPSELHERPQPVAALFPEQEEPDCDTITQTVIEELASACNTFIAGGFTPFLYPYGAALMHSLGDPLVSVQGDKKIEGFFLGIDPTGALILKVDGVKRLFASGEWG